MKFGYTIAGFEGVNTPVESGINYAKNDLESIQARLDAETYEIAMFESLSEFKKYEVESVILSDFSTGLEADGSITNKVPDSNAPWYKKLWEKIKAMFKAIGEFFMNFFRWIGRKLGIIKEGIRTKYVLFLAKHTWVKKAVDFILRKKPNGEITDADIEEGTAQTEAEIIKEIQADRVAFESVSVVGTEGLGIWKAVSGFFGNLKKKVVNYIKGLVNKYRTPDELKRAAGAMRVAQVMFAENGGKTSTVDVLDILKRTNPYQATTSGGNIKSLINYLRSYTAVIATMQQDKEAAKELSESKDYDNEAMIEQTIATAKRVLSVGDDKLFSIHYKEMSHYTVYEAYKDSQFEYLQKFLDMFNELANTFSKNFESQYKYIKDILDRGDAAESELLKGFLENRDDKVRLEKAKDILSMLRDCGTKLSNISRKLIVSVSEIESYISSEDKDAPEKVVMSSGEF